MWLVDIRVGVGGGHPRQLVFEEKPSVNYGTIDAETVFVTSGGRQFGIERGHLVSLEMREITAAEMERALMRLGASQHGELLG